MTNYRFIVIKYFKNYQINMRILKTNPILRPGNNYVIDSPQPSNISYWWNVGSLLGLSLGIQIITGITLAMHYNPNVTEAFNSVEHIMRDVNNGWLIRYLHSNTASAFFFLVYLHIGRGLYYGSYKGPRTLVWSIGTIIFILMMATSFLGYVLPYGQMSLWGATVITNLMSAIPWVGQDIVEFIWGGFSVNNATLNRFFSLHFVLPFVLAALALIHLIALHDKAGSNNPLGISGNYDRLAFTPYYIFKDLITIFIFMLLLSFFLFFGPNVLGDSENYVMANPMQTPPAIVPEWYLLPFYAILRSIPNKLIGVIAMFSALLALLSLAFIDSGKSRGLQTKPISKVVFFIFVANLIILMILGAKHVESPFIEVGQIATVIYFAFFIISIFFSNLENVLGELFSSSYFSFRKVFSKANASTKISKKLINNYLSRLNTVFNVRYFSSTSSRNMPTQTTKHGIAYALGGPFGLAASIALSAVVLIVTYKYGLEPAIHGLNVSNSASNPVVNSPFNFRQLFDQLLLIDLQLGRLKRTLNLYEDLQSHVSPTFADTFVIEFQESINKLSEAAKECPNFNAKSGADMMEWRLTQLIAGLSNFEEIGEDKFIVLRSFLHNAIATCTDLQKYTFKQV
jgi:ubiquinol-cytochrome c reductase cytochrome b subunit